MAMGRVFSILLVGSAALLGQGVAQRDLYPEVRALLLEAELAANGLRELADGLNPWTRMGEMYARAGYVADAERVMGPTKEPSYRVWQARVVYGDLAGAEASFEKIGSPESKAACYAAMANLLWRMQEPELARSRFEKARKLAARIPELKGRTQVLASVRLGLTYVGDQPPSVVTPVPQPRQRRSPSEPTLPDFPMTTGGFREQTPAIREALMRSDEAFLKALYDRMASKDRDGTFALAERAKTVRQRSLGYAAIGHILIQGAQAEAAEETIRRMPEMDVDSQLAKAEALTETGAAWLRQGKSDRADGCFREARGLVEGVKELPLARLLVTLRMARAQSVGGMVSSAAEGLRKALALAEGLPVRPPLVPGRRPVTPAGVKYRDEGFQLILPVAILARDLGVATTVEEKWKESGSSIATEWLNAGHKDLALAVARRIEDQQERVAALLNIASQLLDEGGAPSF